MNFRGYITWIPTADNRRLAGPTTRTSAEPSEVDAAGRAPSRHRSPAPDQQGIPHFTDWLTTGEAAAYSRGHRNTVLIALRRGELAGYQRRAPQGEWRIRRTDLETWISGGSPRQ
ncbi:helix-turn-helix domain-containing protein [Rhodococcus hoagii]|nr:helix-turn-helix domain-containing protein [Prescottella equi]